MLKSVQKVVLGIATYLPREGPETPIFISVIRIEYSSLSPREGPETHIGLYLILKYSLYSYLSTSRGAGNQIECLTPKSM